MYLIVSIVLATVLGLLLGMMGPLVGGFITFGIIVGCLFRGLYLLSDIRKRLSNEPPNYDKVKDAYETYLKEKETNS